MGGRTAYSIFIALVVSPLLLIGCGNSENKNGTGGSGGGTGGAGGMASLDGGGTGGGAGGAKIDGGSVDAAVAVDSKVIPDASVAMDLLPVVIDAGVADAPIRQDAPIASPDAVIAMDSAVDSPGDGGFTCLGDVSSFADFATYWVDGSTLCGSVNVSGGTVTLTRKGGCATDAGSTNTTARTVLSPQWKLCGDFDIQVAYHMTAFQVPTTDWDSATLRAYDPAQGPEDLFSPNKNNGMASERWDNASFNPSQTYKAYTTNANDSDSSVVHVATTDSAGIFRITRNGTTVNAYYASPAGAGADGGTWILLKSATLPSTPWTVELYTAAASDTVDQTVELSGFAVSSRRP